MPELTLSELVGILAEKGMPCGIEGDPSVVVRAVNTLADAVEGELSFLANPKYRKQLTTTRASAVLVSNNAPPNGRCVKLRCQNPYAAVAFAVDAIHGRRQHPQWGLSDEADISPKARIGPGANIAAGVSIEADVVIGAKATIYPGCYVGKGVTIGDEVTLFANAVIYDGSKLGHRVTIHAGTVIGQDGVGYAPVDGKWIKIPQAGHVELGDDVEIGALCAIDRATLGVTRIGRGTKFSNLIAIGHGTKIGEDCMMVAQVGIAGSVDVGNHVVMGGQVGVAGHVTIGDRTQVAGRSGVLADIPADQKIMGLPAVPSGDARRQLILVQRLPAMRLQIRQMQAEIDRLTQLVEGEKRPSGGSSASSR